MAGLSSSSRRELTGREVSAGVCAAADAKRPPDVRGARREGIVAGLRRAGVHFDMFSWRIGRFAQDSRRVLVARRLLVLLAWGPLQQACCSLKLAFGEGSFSNGCPWLGGRKALWNAKYVNEQVMLP